MFAECVLSINLKYAILHIFELKIGYIVDQSDMIQLKDILL